MSLRGLPSLSNFWMPRVSDPGIVTDDPPALLTCLPDDDVLSDSDNDQDSTQEPVHAFVIVRRAWANQHG